MQHCPSAVAGAKTEIKDNKDSVEVTVTATDAAKTDEIRKRAKHVVDAAKQDPATVVRECREWLMHACPCLAAQSDAAHSVSRLMRSVLLVLVGFMV